MYIHTPMPSVPVLAFSNRCQITVTKWHIPLAQEQSFST